MFGFSKRDGEVAGAMLAALAGLFAFAKLHDWWVNRAKSPAVTPPSPSGGQGTVQVIGPDGSTATTDSQGTTYGNLFPGSFLGDSYSSPRTQGWVMAHSTYTGEPG